MLAAFITEFIGTFVFLAVIITLGQPIPSVIGLLAAIYLGGHISGGHFNPAVSTMMFAKGDITVERYIGYVAAQVLGGLAALLWWQSMPKAAVSATPGRK